MNASAAQCHDTSPDQQLVKAEIVIRTILAAVLMFAVAAKLWAYLARPTAESLPIAAAVIEMMVVVGLLRPTWRTVGYWFALLLFVVFCGVAWQKVLLRQLACPCLGLLAAPPLVMALLDLFVVLGVLAVLRVGPRARVCVAVVSLLAVGGIAVYPQIRPNSNGVTFSRFTSIFGDKPQAVLVPSKWTNNRFPLIDYVHSGDLIANGDWIVMLHSQSCDKCRETAALLSTACRVAMSSSLRPKVVFIDVASTGEYSVDSQMKAYFETGLTTDVDWILTPPILLRIQNGTVIELLDGKSALKLLGT